MNILPRTLFVFLAMFALSTGACLCQDSASHAAVTLELLNAMNMDKTLDQTMDVSLAAQLKANPSLQPYEDIMRRFFSKYITWNALKDRMVAIYMGEFTEDEMRKMLDFYTTDVGKKVIERLPVLFAKGGELGKQAVQEHMSELTDSLKVRWDGQKHQ